MQTLPASDGLDSIITPCSRFVVPPLRGLLPLRYRPAASFSRKLLTLLIFTDKKKEILPHAILRVVKGSNLTRTDSEKPSAILVTNACPFFFSKAGEATVFTRVDPISVRKIVLRLFESNTSYFLVGRHVRNDFKFWKVYRANSFANVSIDRIPNRRQR